MNLVFPIQKSEKQINLERQGHIFRGQESLANHEADPEKECYCRRPIQRANKIKST